MVIDASVWISSLIPSEAGFHASRAFIRRTISSGARVVLPTILIPEVGGAIARRNQSLQDAVDAIALIDQITQVEFVRLEEATARLANSLAMALRLRGADAVYVAVALRFRLPLITWDTEQLTRTAGVIDVYTPGTVPA